MNDRRCTQTKCDFYLQGGCKNCSKCKAEPYHINTACGKCLRCEGVPNELRWGDNTNKVVDEVFEIVFKKPEEKLVEVKR